MYDPKQPVDEISRNTGTWYNVYICDHRGSACWGIETIQGLDAAIKRVKECRAEGYMGTYLFIASSAPSYKIKES